MSVRTPDAADLRIGTRLREKRRERKITQAALAKAIGVTFQQIQKYENGVNRIPGSRIPLIAETLGESVAYFYGDPEAARLMSGFNAIQDERKRAAIITLVESLSHC